MGADGVPRFAVDRSLGRLARWLRLLGFDAVRRTDMTGARLLTLAAREGRVLLTRDRGLARRPGAVRVLCLESDRFREQLSEIDRAIPLGGAEARQPRCADCNESLEPLPVRSCPRPCRPIRPRDPDLLRALSALPADLLGGDPLGAHARRDRRAFLDPIAGLLRSRWRRTRARARRPAFRRGRPPGGPCKTCEREVLAHLIAAEPHGVGDAAASRRGASDQGDGERGPATKRSARRGTERRDVLGVRALRHAPPSRRLGRRGGPVAARLLAQRPDRPGRMRHGMRTWLRGRTARRRGASSGRASSQAELAERLVDDDRHRVGEIQAPHRRARHRDPVERRELAAQLLGEAARLAAEHQRIVVAKRDLRVGRLAVALNASTRGGACAVRKSVQSRAP